ncbi:MAG: DUF7133 domain-containing protein, partial [Gemmataceae bacterium]
DNWIYACHGFANSSIVAGSDGHRVSMNSGHTFRFQADGSRIEVVSRGQVNPFGMTVDTNGFLYTADCHSKPITQIIPGAFYDSFGKPHDGLGYAPHVTKHDHGSTGLCGLVYYTGAMFPAEYRGRMFLGNVVTNRINSDKLEYAGSSPVAIEQPDFLTSTDPWFRPTDLKQGPDGALYITDFYNRIIGHYEVDLKHPGRDKLRGRVWRIVYDTAKSENSGPTPTMESKVAELRKLQAQGVPSAEQRKQLLAMLGKEPISDRIHLEILAGYPQGTDLGAIAEFNPASADSHLKQMQKIALRNTLAQPGSLDPLREHPLSPAAMNRIDTAMLGHADRSAADWFVNRWRMFGGTLRSNAIQHISRYGTDAHRAKLWADLELISEVESVVEALRVYREGAFAAGKTLPKTAEEWPKLLRAEIRRRLPGGTPAEAKQALQWANITGFPVQNAAQALLRNSTADGSVRELALQILAERSDGKLELWQDCGEVLTSSTAPEPLKLKATGVLATSTRAEDRTLLQAALKTAPYRFAVAMAAALAQSQRGAETLLLAVESGQAAARLLQERSVQDLFRAARIPDWQSRVGKLTQGLPGADRATAELIARRAKFYKTATPDLTKGRTLFTQHCANCHQLQGTGAKVGPQLDGIGNRGLERLLEDTLDPSRNVDAAFRATTVEMDDGRTLLGYLARTEGATIVLVDGEGKEQRLAAADIVKKTITPLSPMPTNALEKLSEAEFAHLMGYLLDQRAK